MPGDRQVQESLDVSSALDNAGWGSYQKLVLAMAASAVILDGMDNQLLAYALPVISREWNAPRTAFGLVFALGLAAMIAGTLIFGWLADRVGRRKILIGSVFLFGAATALTALAQSIPGLILGRVTAGLGLGGAIPCAIALISEFTPSAQRGRAVVLGSACVPLGGVVAGLLSAQILPTLGWRPLFLIAGVIPCVLAVGFLFLMPESPRFLMVASRNRQALVKILNRLGVQVTDNTVLRDSSAVEIPRASIRVLVAPAFRRDTLLLCTAFFSCQIGVYLTFNWLPTLLTSEGFSLTAASQGLALFNLGGVVGAVLAALCLARQGIRATIMAAAVGACAVILLIIAPFTHHVVVLLGLLCVAGAFVIALQVLLFPLATNAYPVQIRSTGVGLALGIGRSGSVLSSALGPVIILGGLNFFMLTLAVVIGLAGFAALAVQRHRRPAAAEAP